MIGLTTTCQVCGIRFAGIMCSRLNQFANLPALSIAGKALRIERRKKKSLEDAKSEVQVVNNICPTDYADVLTMGECASAAEAVELESMLLLKHRPPFNRDGVWKGEPWWLLGV